MRSEYRFDYSKSRPNRFATPRSESAVAVVLDADVATVFRTSESVNSLLRSVISALPAPERPAPSRSRRAV
jgi:hypothetical protein